MEQSEKTSGKEHKYEPCDGCDKAPVDCEGFELCEFLKEKTNGGMEEKWTK